MNAVFRIAIVFLVLSELGSCNVKPVPITSSTPQPIPIDALVVKNGNVIDGTGAAPIRNGVVIIVKDKIFAVGRAVDFSTPSDARIVDAHGGTIMPGIINAHVHSASSPLVRKYYYLRHGVTTVCDVGSAMPDMPRFADNSGYAFTARGFRTGPVINVPEGYPGNGEFLYPVTNPDEARQAVTDLVSRGADMIKTAVEPWNSKLPWPAPPPGDPIPNLDLPTLQAIVEQAHAHGKIVRVHLGTQILLDFALDGGVDSVEHVPLPQLSDIDFSKTQNGGYAKLSERFEAQLARMVRQHVFMVPTLNKIVPWCEGYANSAERKKLCSDYALAPVHRFHQLGGTIALGDDSASELRTTMPIGEMQRLAQAGLSPMEIIQAGTKYAAQVCGHGNELGTLEPGKFADVIVVNGNPLRNIEVMEQIETVIVGGVIAVPCDPTKQNAC
ncbi:MAG: amidohydrolase family protein [Chloroflexi bacterium]|nr:amidohydrolase family protein [Chloroflexota bacterium]